MSVKSSGTAFTASAAQRAFLWTPGTGMLDLGTLGGTNSRAYGVNDAGQVVGESRLPSGQTHAFFWSAATGMVDLGTLGGTYSYGRAINLLGQVTGFATLAGDSYFHAYRWSPGGSPMIDVGTLGGLLSAGLAMNDSGQLVGWAENAAGAPRAFSRTGTAPMVNLGTLGGNFSRAARGEQRWPSRGIRRTATAETHATTWSGPWKDLVVNFGAGSGLWALRQTAWLPVHGANPKAMVSGDFDGNGLDDLAIDFSPYAGLWLYMNHANWIRSTP